MYDGKYHQSPYMYIVDFCVISQVRIQGGGGGEGPGENGNKYMSHIYCACRDLQVKIQTPIALLAI